jgi:hypothetical protein
MRHTDDIRRLNTRRTALLSSAAFLLAGATPWPLPQFRPSGGETAMTSTGTVLAPTDVVAPGTTVALYALPSNATVAAEVAGHTAITMRLLGTSTTDPLGHYSLPVLRPEVLALMANPDGLVNLRLFAFGPDGMTVTGYPISATRPVLAQVSLHLHKVKAVNRGVHAYDLPTWCSHTFVRSYGARTTHVGQTYSTVPGVSQQFVYTNGATTELGLGLSTSTAFGSFSEVGTTSYESSLTENFGGQPGKQFVWYYTAFVEGLFKNTCTDSHGNSRTEYQVEPTGFAGGASIAHPSKLPYTPSCVWQIKGSHPQIQTSTAVSWSTGLDVSTAVGVDLSARTGYSHTAYTSYYYNSPAWLCGERGYPGGSGLLHDPAPAQLAAIP